MASFMKEFEHLEIKLEDIKSATNNFNENKVNGIGGFGKVYEGELSRHERKIMVAFKRLDRKHGQGDPEFFKEIIMLSCYKHKNLISLLGFCQEADEMILIYEHASRGSLDRILNKAALTWTQRLKICIDAAKGLSFLHDPNGTQQRVLHRDIKSANILLDENLNAKVADFGLSKLSPANQRYTFLFTSPVGTPGYCDPLYMDDYQLTKESDVYSFGVVLFEVLCGRVCFENSEGNFMVFVNQWKRCYEQNKLDEIIFPDLSHQMDSSSVRTFVDIAYQCLQISREQRPTMSVVVEKLKAALVQREHEQEQIRKAAEYEAEQICKAAEHEAEQMRKAADYEQIRKAMRKAVKQVQILKAAEYEAEQVRKAAEFEQIRKAMRKTAKQVKIRKPAEYEAEQEQMRKAVEQEYKEILKSADPPLRFLEFPVNGGKTIDPNNSADIQLMNMQLLTINDKGEVFCERIYIEACMGQFQYDRLQDPSGFENSRFPGGRCYYKHEDELNIRVRAQFLYPRITYSVNLVFRNALQSVWLCQTLHYKLDGVTKCCMVYDTYEREDGWFVVPLYKFTSDHKTAEFEINFQRFRDSCKLQVAGFEFQPLEENVELNDQWLEEYQDIVKAASQSLFYKSPEELKGLLSKGCHINNYKTWFSLNENGEHCEMLSISHCLISCESGNFYNTRDLYSRFPCFFQTNKKRFKVHIRTQFLTPSIRYTVNIVLCKATYWKQKYVALRYKIEGETETSIVYLATETQDGYSFIAELYQFTSIRRTFDIEIVFEDHKDDLEVEGILFQPLEKVEHEQVLEDEKLSDDLQWTFNKEDMCTNHLKWFIDNGQEGYSVDKNGKKCLMLSARGAIRILKKMLNKRFKPSLLSANTQLRLVEHEQVLEDEKLSDDLQWTFNKEDMCTNHLKWFIDNGQEGYSVDKNGKKCLMLSARGAIRSYNMSFQSLPESSFFF
ncbi:protein kinase, ATP binding site, Serine/threonine-protein kinase Plk3 [Artemisia annua]|uniref:Protein kinase, ATP binding site, Serine/threonine-protein kinase Plk3 n=1 Tax=Artemisia annua TaxID=35608 RepID=A0A2U1LWJ6_ARTAN|nr:protein kinase, ATP binding site, Serine/threonine-protein kinase Plk3 [Artemisia annua]